MQKVVVGILAHVDAGKTTLSEALLYGSGSIRKLGRVDNKDAFLDTYDVERERGITVFSKQAVFPLGEMQVTLLDTPGHVDFSAEMERTLQVLDYAILVISGADGVQGHTRTLWRLLRQYGIPVFLFINKMDQPGADRGALMQELKENLSENCVDFTDSEGESFGEEVAVCSEEALEQFLETGKVEKELVRQFICSRKVYPCYFGSALKTDGVEEFLAGMAEYICPPVYGEQFGARVFKIGRDPQGNRLTYLKITGGTLKVKETIGEEKVNQIRLYSGEKYETATEAWAGTVCAVTGLTQTRPGEGLGAEGAEMLPVLEPVLNYHIVLPEGMDAAVMLPKLRELEEEEPQLHIVWNEAVQEIHAKVMGEVQIEILQGMIRDRYGVEVSFGDGNIVYKETISNTVEGVGHFEPLRHYAEVHLLLEPGEEGSGLQFGADVSEDDLSKNWQRLVLTHLEEKEHKGVLTGSAITDMKITLIAGRAHLKHTEGGDFREATYRAVRQGLKEAESVLLEPYYEFRLEVPEKYIGRSMTDIERMRGTFAPPEMLEGQNAGMAVLKGSAPVQTMRNYQKEVTSYTKGEGRLFCELKGYAPCHNQEEIIEQMGYDSEADLENPTGSVFCAHGAGFVVPWYEVKDYMHVESRLSDFYGEAEFDGDSSASDTEWKIGNPDQVGKGQGSLERQTNRESQTGSIREQRWLGTDEIDAILDQTYNANRRYEGRNNKWAGIKNASIKNASIHHASNSAPVTRTYTPSEKKEEYLLVDGYNVIFAWEDLKELAQVTIDGARGKLLDILCNYQGIKKCNLIVVFDAYRVQGHQTEISDYHNIHVVFTKEAETADQYIEKFAHENGRKYQVTVATSDGLEQIIIRGQGCLLLSARELREEVERCSQELRENYLERQSSGRNLLEEHMPDIVLPDDED